MFLSTAALTGAAGLTSTEALVYGAVVAAVIVAALLLAFMLGARRQVKEPEPDPEPHSPERDAWATPPTTPGHAPHGDPTAPQHVVYTRP